MPPGIDNQDVSWHLLLCSSTKISKHSVFAPRPPASAIPRPSSSAQLSPHCENRVNLARLATLNIFLGGDMLDADRPAQLTDQLLKVIMSELEREPRTPDNVWCVLDAVACVVAGLIKEPEALRYYGRHSTGTVAISPRGRAEF